jgi:hypothetical protein
MMAPLQPGWAPSTCSARESHACHHMMIGLNLWKKMFSCNAQHCFGPIVATCKGSCCARTLPRSLPAPQLVFMPHVLSCSHRLSGHTHTLSCCVPARWASSPEAVTHSGRPACFAMPHDDMIVAACMLHSASCRNTPTTFCLFLLLPLLATFVSTAQ